MKTIKINIAIISILFAATFATPSAAQSVRPISKDVQRVNNRWLQAEKLFTVASVDAYAGSKDVVFINNISRRVNQSGNIKSVGTPLWIISKPVHQRQQVTPVRFVPSPAQDVLAAK